MGLFLPGLGESGGRKERDRQRRLKGEEIGLRPRCLRGDFLALALVALFPVALFQVCSDVGFSHTNV